MFQGLCHASLRSFPGRCAVQGCSQPRAAASRSLPVRGSRAAPAHSEAQGRSRLPELAQCSPNLALSRDRALPLMVQFWQAPSPLLSPSGIVHSGTPAVQCSLAAVFPTRSIGTKTSFKYTLILRALFSSYSSKQMFLPSCSYYDFYI